MKIKKIIAIFVCALTVLSFIPNKSLGLTYEGYFDENPKITENLGEEFSLLPSNAVRNSADFSDNYNEKSAIVFSNGTGSAEWQFECETDGVYNIRFNYFPIKNKKLDIEIGLKIDGEYPFDDAKSFNLNRVFKNDGEILKDSKGNDYNPQQIEVYRWLTDYFKSNSGNYDIPMKIYLEKGIHTLKLDVFQEPFALGNIDFVPVREKIDYKEYRSLYKDKKGDDFSKKFEAESASLKSDYSLLALNDRSSIYTTPFSYTLQKLNKIGGDTWKGVGQWLEWEIEVPDDGYYFINFRYSQSYNKGLPSNRRLYINGEVPFKEADRLCFDYEPDWDMFSLKADGEDAEYYLKKGVNTIRLEVTLGDVSAIASELEEIIFSLNEYYRQIIMITGSDPDTYRDYNIEKEIPALPEDFTDISKRLLSVYENVRKITGGKGDSGNILKVLSHQLDGMVEKPATIPFRMNSMSSNIGTLSSWVLEIKAQALDLDYILVSNNKTEIKSKEGFFDTLKREFLYFIYSFIADYNTYDADSEGESISVWLNIGREQASIIRRMIDDLYTPETGTAVSLKLTTANAMQAFLSGNTPDVMLNVARGLPTNLALRGALYDLTEFDDFEQVKAQFSKTGIDPYKIGESVYALPQTETFYMLFAREDVLGGLGIEVPETWDEFYYVLQRLQLNGLLVGVPYTGVDSSAAVDAGIGSKNLFSAFLLQSGGSFYNKELTGTSLSNQSAITAFEQWTDLYSEYGVPLSYNFFNRFRTGEMPLAIALYTEYNQLKAAAPEIAGLWNMYPIPGTLMEDGSINRAQGGDGTACVITSTTKNPEKAWSFIKWWTGNEAQTRYGSDLEAVLGVAGRHPTANLEAMKNQQWTAYEYSVLERQSREVIEIPVIAGSYYLTRGIDNAFREVVYDDRNAKEALIVWDREISDEIARKREEFFDE